jgi:hypothetical protein
MSIQAGQFMIEGSLSGPSSSWALTEVKLAQALQNAGAPAKALRLHVEGGWLTLEPGRSDGIFDQIPTSPAAEAIGQALRDLLQAVPPHCAEAERAPLEWASTLRLTEYHAEQKFEVLFGLTAQGLQAVGRESPWRPVPPRRFRDWWQANGRIALAILIAVASMAYLQREVLKQEWQKWTTPAAAIEHNSSASESAK